MGRRKLFDDQSKWCNKCSQQLPLDAFGFNRRTASGRQDYCISCHAKYYESSLGTADSAGFVYVIGNANAGMYKIGCAVNPESRLQRLQASSPLLLTLVTKKHFDKMIYAERAVHILLHQFRQHGEWFALTTKQAIEALNGVASGNNP
jgi:T5orf172 domain